MQFAKRLIMATRLELLLSIFIGIGAFVAVRCYQINILPLSPIDFYYAFFGAVIQGFIGLVAFLGAVATFQLQINQNQMQNQIHWFVLQKQAAVITAHDSIGGDILRMKKGEYISRIKKESRIEEAGQEEKERADVGLSNMYDVLNFEWEVRDSLIKFTFLSFLDVLVAIVALASTKFLSATLGTTSITLVLTLSILVLGHGFYLVRRVIGLS